MLLASVLYAAFLPLLGWTDSFWTLALFGFAGNLLNILVNTQAIGMQQFYDKPIERFPSQCTCLREVES